MFRTNRMLGLFGCACCAALMVGCASKERAVVAFEYEVNQGKGLPPGMKTLYVVPAKCGPGTDPKWSDMCATALRSLIIESKTNFGTDIRIVDREDTNVTYDEADMAAAGMSTGNPARGGQITGADGAVLADITIKEDVKRGKQRTISGMSMWGGGGHGWGHGGGSVDTEEVDTATRNLVVQMEFKLLDTANNDFWAHLKPKTYNATDRTEASPIFGSSQTEAELTPADQIVGGLVEKACREFVSELMPIKISVDTEIVSSSNEHCAQGVKMLRAEMWNEALESFEAAMAEDMEDHQAAFGAGLACEAMGRFADAERYYKQACVGADEPSYADARDRVKRYGARVRSMASAG